MNTKFNLIKPLTHSSDSKPVISSSFSNGVSMLNSKDVSVPLSEEKNLNSGVVVQKCRVDIWKTNQEPKGMDMGGGILGISVSPVYGEIYLLLGKEQERNLQDRIDDDLNMKPEPEISKTSSIWQNKKYWSDLGGTKNENDDSIEATCAREFEEESLGLISTSDTYWKNKNSILNLTNDLKNQNFLLKIVTSTNYGIKDQKEKRLYTTFVKHIPWQPEISFKFEMIHRLLKQMSLCCRAYEKYTGQIQSSNYLFPGQIIECEKEIFYRIGRPVFVSSCRVIFETTIFCNRQMVNKGLYTFVFSDEEKEIFYEYKNALFNKSISKEHILYSKAMNYYLQMWNLYHYKLVPHHFRPIFHIKTDKFGGLLYDVFDKYLEKQSLEYWNLNCIKHMLNNGGHMKREIFRPACLPMLAILVDWIEKQTMAEKPLCLLTKNGILSTEKESFSSFGHVKYIFSGSTSYKFYEDEDHSQILNSISPSQKLKMHKSFFIKIQPSPTKPP